MKEKKIKIGQENKLSILSMEKHRFGHASFVLGVLLAILSALMSKEYVPYVTTALLIWGTIVGFLNISKKEWNTFMIASILLLVLSNSKFGLVIVQPEKLGFFLANAIGNIAIFVTPAALIVTLKAIWVLEED
ncbi:MAG: hypothetical protein AABX33_02690 [Nanoarchaeota archaeon]